MGSPGRFIDGRTKREGVTELEIETRQIRPETATLLRELADQLESGCALTMDLGERRGNLDPTESLRCKLEGESD